MVLLFGNIALAEKQTIPLFGKEAVMAPRGNAAADGWDGAVRDGMELALGGAVKPDSPLYKYLAAAKPEKVLALIGKSVDGAEVRQFLAPLSSAVRREDVLNTILLRGLGLRIDFEASQVDNTMFVHSEHLRKKRSVRSGARSTIHPADPGSYASASAPFRMRQIVKKHRFWHRNAGFPPSDNKGELS